MFFLPVLICSKKFLGQGSGTLFTPKWPLTYIQNAYCEWNISVPQGKAIRLFYTSFKLGGNALCDPDRKDFKDEIRITGKCTIICQFSIPYFNGLLN